MSLYKGESGRWVSPDHTEELAMTRRTMATPPELPARWLTVADLAEMLNVSQDLIRSLVHKRLIPFCKFGKLVRFDPKRIAQWLIDQGFDPL
jgi:excisionase family DNA binding protein